MTEQCEWTLNRMAKLNRAVPVLGFFDAKILKTNRICHNPNDIRLLTQAKVAIWLSPGEGQIRGTGPTN